MLLFLHTSLASFMTHFLLLGDALSQGLVNNQTIINQSDALQEYWVFEICSIAGTIVGAIGGAMASSRVRMDIFGIICCGTLAALGGGTLRDILLQGFVTPSGEECRIYWVTTHGEVYLYYAVFTSILTFYIAKFYTPPLGTLRVLDAFGMAFFTLFGATKAHLMGCPWLVSVGMGVVTGVAGGALRDLATGNVPYVFRPGELYATAAFVGAASYLILENLNIPVLYSYSLAVFICFITRLAAVYLNWQLPSYRPIYEDRVSKSDEA